MKYIVLFLFLFLSGCQLTGQEITVNERLEQIDKKSGESATWMAMKAQASYHLANRKFASSIDLLEIESFPNDYSLSIQRATQVLTIIESAPIDKQEGNLYFIGVINVQVDNPFSVLCEANKPYSEIGNINKLREGDCYVHQKS